MEDIVREPMELVDDDLDAVAGGGNAFGATADHGATVTNNGHFNIGVIQGDSSTATGIFIGQLRLNEHIVTHG